MTLALLILIPLMLAGSWLAWRKSPLYSLKITLKLVGITLAIIGLIMGVTQLNLSTNALLFVLLPMIPIVGIGGTALIIRVTDGHVAQLPSSARLITTHRHKIQQWIWRVVIFIVICAAVGLVLPDPWRGIPWGLGGLLLLGCGPTFVALYMRARRLDLGMSQVTACPWVHWQYTPDQWQAWARNQLEWERSKAPPFSWKRDGIGYLKSGAILGVIFLGCSFVELHGSLGEKLLVSFGFTVGIMLLVVWINWFNRRYCERRYRRLLAAPPEVYFGDEGLFANGEYTQWIFSGSYLKEMDAVSNPPLRLGLLFQTFNGSSSALVARRIPIPEGHESDLEILQQKLRVTCPKAILRLAILASKA